MSVAAYFARLWVRATEAGPARRALAEDFWPRYRGRLVRATGYDDEDQVIQVLSDFHATQAAEGWELSATLAVMKAIDEQFSAIHPRIHLMPTSAARPALPDWLLGAEADRVYSGAYWRDADRRVIAKGPLSRGMALPEATDTLSDRFSALTVVSGAFEHDTRAVPISMRVLTPHATTGIRLTGTPGAERVAFAPIAEAGVDLEPSVHTLAAGRFLDVRPASTLRGGQRLLDAARAVGPVDILVAPELVMSDADFIEFQNGLTSSAGSNPLLTLAGSGLTAANSAEGLSWNEARMVNPAGAVLWRQKKLSPYAMKANTAFDLGLVTDSVGGPLVEYVANGEDLTIVDTDGLGRCLILICQDFQSDPIVANVIKAYQPDWVFVPIMDTGVGPTRWPQIRTNSLSSTSQARYLVVSSLAMCHWNATCVSPPPVGLAVGPAVPSPDGNGDLLDAKRVAKSATLPTTGGGPRVVTIRWRDHDWDQVSIAVVSGAGAPPAGR
ncbi:MAG: hypothetical protein P0Y65_00105 [Candidatus Devosia phytovorans]|uniref:Uncharacterized protein n=1 Tax=Candidatus Devosia phytovorans TaxID=3121372 RepID=A0AAJ5VWI1_9HYPH|nr:hypothetical protein [Devosia sp.]WEK04698.1 MAG: hypothetical protein P0Y65_00105 [Devosia sp.]